MTTATRRRFQRADGRAAVPPASSKVTFPELVHLHFLWRRALGAAPGDGGAPYEEVRRRYDDALERFQATEGEIVSAYWCSDVESAVALTFERRGGRRPGTGWTVTRFHRVSDWATRDHPDVARLLHDCDELAVKAREVLAPKSQRICMQLVMASAGHLLSVVDGASAVPRPPVVADALSAERAELQAAREYYREAANGEAQMVYFGGMGAGVAVLLALALLCGGLLGSGGIDRQAFFGAMSAGALGALVSVIARINDGTFALDYDVSPVYSLFTGALRPVIGALFGLAVYAAIASGLLQVFRVPATNPEHFYFVCVTSFIAGFSERWAQDTLTSVAPAARTPGEKPAEHRPAPPSDRGGDDVPR